VHRYRGAKIQILDLPGIIEGAKDGKGRGRQVISAARTCDMILIVLDCMKPVTHKRLIEHELAGFGIRLNGQPPEIIFRKKDKGGINYQELVPQTKVIFFSFSLSFFLSFLLTFFWGGQAWTGPRPWAGRTRGWVIFLAPSPIPLTNPSCSPLFTISGAPFLSARGQGLGRDQCTRILKEFRIASADVILRGDYDADAFIDVVSLLLKKTCTYSAAGGGGSPEHAVLPC